MANTIVRKSAGPNSKETEALKNISSMVNRSLQLDAILISTLDEIKVALGMDAGVFRLHAAPEASPKTVSKGFGKEIAAVLKDPGDETTGQQPPMALISGDATQWGAGPLPDALRTAGMQFYAAYPIRAGNRLLGYLGLAGKSARGPNKAQEEFLFALCEILGVAVINAQLRDQASKLSEDFIALQELNKIISQSFNLEDIIQRIVIEGKRLAKTNQCHLFLLDDQSQCLIGSASTQTENLDIRKLKITFSEVSPAVTALVEMRVIAIEDIPHDQRAKSELMESLGWRAAIFAPLLTKEQAIGVLVCSDDSHERKFTDEEILRAETLAHQASIALENARLFQRVSRSQREWETTFDAMQDCVSVHDTMGKVIRANVALAHRLKTIPQKVIGRYCSGNLQSGRFELEPLPPHAPLKSETLIVEEMTLPRWAECSRYQSARGTTRISDWSDPSTSPKTSAMKSSSSSSLSNPKSCPPLENSFQELPTN